MMLPSCGDTRAKAHIQLRASHLHIAGMGPPAGGPPRAHLPDAQPLALAAQGPHQGVGPAWSRAGHSMVLPSVGLWGDAVAMEK